MLAAMAGGCVNIPDVDDQGSNRGSLQQGGPGICQAYGTRNLKLLSSIEYQNSLETLLDVPVNYGSRVANYDGYLGGFRDMTGRTVSGTSLESYLTNASEVAVWAVNNDKPFTCNNNTECSQRFVDEFLFTAFRGRVTEAQKQAYRDLFARNPANGLLIALQAALSSPSFLYRVEVGVSVDTARSRGYYAYDPSSSPPETSISDTPTQVFAANAFPPGSSGRLADNEWEMTQNGQVFLTLPSPLTDPAIIEVRARGTNHGAIWPELTLRIADTIVGTQTVNSQSPVAYTFEVNGFSGVQQLSLEFANDSGVPPYNAGNDTNLYFTDVAVYNTADNFAVEQPSAPIDLLANVDPNAFILSPYELVSALSFQLTGAPPDANLLRQASSLTSPDRIRKQAQQLITSQRGRRHLANFVSQWFKLDGLRNVVRNDNAFTNEVKEAMLQEVAEHFTHVFFNESIPFSEFYNGNYTFLNSTLANFYGISGNFDNTFRKTEVVGRGGPIASGAFMTVNAHIERTSPIFRGVHVRESALCQSVPQPNSEISGDNIDEQRAEAQAKVSAAEAAGGRLSSREFYSLYTDNISACAPCHERIINPNFGMEDFDNIGRLRPLSGTTATETLDDNTQRSVALNGILYGVQSIADPTTLTYAGAKDLSNKIADTETADTCLARRSFRFLTGLPSRPNDVDSSSRLESFSSEQLNSYNCVTEDALNTFNTNNKSPMALFLEIAERGPLLFRR